MRVTLPVRTALPPAADEAFDRFAGLVRTILDVPVALVSLVDETRQVLPGASGLPADVDAQRSTPLSHSFCQHVVTSSSPLVIGDARVDPLVRDNLAVRDLAVIAYAGMPLTDTSGRVIGSLCAIDREPRVWTLAELALLADLAAACSSELHVREFARRASAAYERTRTLVDLSQALAGATTIADVSAAVARMATDRLGASFAAVALLDESGSILSYQHAPALPVEAAAFSVNADTPSAIAVRTRSAQFYASLGELETRGAAGLPATAALGARSLACLPLIVGPRVLGTLSLFWPDEDRPDEEDRAVVLSLAEYAAQAVHRAELGAARRNAARILQAALLPKLPSVPGFELDGRYEPAHESDQVGGDWYDAFLMTGPAAAGTLMVSVGDVAGHDTAAAAVMGQVRSSLRTLLIDRNAPPNVILERLDRVHSVESADRLVTAVLAGFEPTADGAVLTWSNAGHLPPVLVAPGAAPRLLEARPDPLLGLGQPWTRTAHSEAIPRGSVVLLYTDGLVEQRGESVSDSLEALLAAVASLQHLPLGALLDGLLAGALSRGHDDDTALFGIRVL